MKKIQKYDFITAIAIYALSIAFIVESFNFKDPQSRVLPRAYAIILIVCMTLLIIKRLRLKDEDSYDYSGSGIALTIIVMMVVYVAATYFVGMYITTPIFLIAAMYYLGMRKWKVLLPVSLGMDIFIYLVFGMVFKVAIPMGVLFGG